MSSVLVVEDDQDLLFLYRSILERSGFEVVETADALEALNQLERRTFEIIILDLQMPDYPGTVVLDYLIDHPDHQEEVVVITANDHMAQEVRDRGVRHILIKPVSMMDVRTLVERLVGG